MISFFSRLLRLAILLLFQALILNHVNVLGYATPLVAAYIVMIFPLNAARWQSIFWGFVAGVGQDMLCGTPGLGAASLTLAGLLQPAILRLTADKEFASNEDYPAPSAAAMKWSAFTRYVFGFVLLQVFVFYVLEAFNFYDFVGLIFNVLGGTVLTTLIILVLESLHFFPAGFSSRK